MDYTMGIAEVLFLPDQEYQDQRDSLSDLYSIYDPGLQEQLNRQLIVNDKIRKAYRSDPVKLERIRKVLETSVRIRRLNRNRRELLTMFSIYNVLHDSDEQYEQTKEEVIADFFVSDRETKELLQRILDGLDELREAFRNDDRMKEILAKLKPAEEEED